MGEYTRAHSANRPRTEMTLWYLGGLSGLCRDREEGGGNWANHLNKWEGSGKNLFCLRDQYVGGWGSFRPCTETRPRAQEKVSKQGKEKSYAREISRRVPAGGGKKFGAGGLIDEGPRMWVLKTSAGR